MNSNELYHHGVKGMKWGVRRYQREDGTRTTAGQKHAQMLGYDSSAGGVASAIRKKQRSNAEKDLARISSKQKQVNSELRELRGYSKKTSKIGRSKLATAIRNQQIKSLEGTNSKLDQRKKESTSALKELKQIDEYQAKKTAEKKAAVKDYSKKFNKASHASDIADQKWTEVKAEYKALGKTRVTRMLNAVQNKTAAAKKYNKDFNTASSMSDKVDALWKESNEAYKKTGRNYVGRVLNNIKYG